MSAKYTKLGQLKGKFGVPAKEYLTACDFWPRAIRLAERRYHAVSLFYKEDNEFIISFFLI